MGFSVSRKLWIIYERDSITIKHIYHHSDINACQYCAVKVTADGILSVCNTPESIFILVIVKGVTESNFSLNLMASQVINYDFFCFFCIQIVRFSSSIVTRYQWNKTPVVYFLTSIKNFVLCERFSKKFLGNEWKVKKFPIERGVRKMTFKYTRCSSIARECSETIKIQIEVLLMEPISG